MEKHVYIDLFFETGLRHQYSAEKAILNELKKMAEKASFSELKKLFHHHMEETKNQIRRLEEIFSLLKIDPHATKLHGLPGVLEKGKEMLKTLADLNFTDRSKGIDGILNEGHELLRHFGGTQINDFALVAAGCRVENYEIACYKSLTLLAEIFEEEEVLDLLDESLDEEIEMEEKITDIASSDLKDALVNSIEVQMG